MNHKSAQIVRTNKDVSSSPKLNQSHSDVVIVSGAAGFVGSRICEIFLDADLSVIGIDNYVSGKEQYLSHLTNREGFEIIEADLQQGIPVGIKSLKPKLIIDALDVYPHIGRLKFGLNELLNNSLGLRNLLEYSNSTQAPMIFTSSVDIYQGLASHESLTNYYDGQELTTYYEYLEGKRYGEALCREYVQTYGLDIRIARIPEVYGPRMDLLGSSIIARAVRMSLEGKDLLFDEDGSKQHHLLYVDDLALGVLKLGLSEEPAVKKGIFYFVNPETVSTLSIAYSLRAIVQKDLKVEFIPHHRKVGFPVPQKIDISRTMKLLHWNPQVDVTEGLERTLRYFKEQTENPPVESASDSVATPVTLLRTKEKNAEELMELEPPKQSEGVNTNGWQNLVSNKIHREKFEEKIHAIPWIKVKRFAFDISLGVGLFLFVVLLPLLFGIGLGYQGFSAVKVGNYSRGEQLFTQVSSLWRYYQIPAQWIGKQDQFQVISNLLDSVTYGLRFVQDGKSAIDEYNPVLNTLFTSLQRGVSVDGYTQQELYQMTSSAVVQWRSAQTWFNLMNKSMDAVDPGLLFEPIKTPVEQLMNVVWLTEPTVENFSNLLVESNTLLGFDGSKNILILFQNSNEIRPTGGFIGSYAIATIEDGKVVNFKIDDIYNPDGQLVQHEDPPVDPIMQKYYDVSFIGIRDANWWADYEKSMSTVIKLYQRATNERVDAVIGINLQVMEDILSSVGSVTIDSLGETITAENVGDKAQVHAEIGFTPGSTQKKDFLGLLGQALFDKLGNLNSDEENRLMLSIGQDILSRDIAFYWNNFQTEQVLKMNQISGAMLIDSAKDYIKVVDNNVGGNKVNYWVERSEDLQLDIGKSGELISTLTISWKNKAQSSTWPQGIYINNVNVYLPSGVRIITTNPALDDYAVIDSGTYTNITGTIKVSISSESKWQIQYQLPARFSLAEKPNYQLIWDNQPGVRNEKVSITINTPSFLSIEGPAQINRELVWPNLITVPFLHTETIQTAQDQTE